MGRNGQTNTNYNGFVQALLRGDLEAMNVYMNDIAISTFSYFDVGGSEGRRIQPEKFYHGFVLGLLAELRDEYELRSNRESGFGRYDVMLLPKGQGKNAIIMEFKVRRTETEPSLEATVEADYSRFVVRDTMQNYMHWAMQMRKLDTMDLRLKGKKS